ncbi:non-ribosomal peptide synthetase [Chitinophaga pendula]|uniref:non-ribosomal peptide synthetase n=1 Tax=Chitinophaga TaxID=79328 RepID=UPI000BAEF987|nr:MULTISPECIES: non-ribosomal peptide synthetase [Chitinophaga]ASZ12183.1 hypothetical protein CK934_15055 [Chitinophaga sp. MD30]UCJ04787.1 non-ribosomal peptide synthetase [Chitinophaga pendula]
MEIKEFIENLRQHHFSLTVDGVKLILKANKSKLTTDEVNAIKNNQEIIAFIKSNKEQLIAYISEEKGRTDNVSAIYRLSALQAGMLFHNLYDEEAGAYRTQLKCDLIGLDLVAFAESWQYVLKNHSILRSSFQDVTFKIPVQCVHTEVTMPIEVLDFRHMGKEEQAEAICTYEEQDSRRGFDLTVAPLMRIVLLQLSDDRYRMLWTTHHLLTDGWSTPVLLEEFLSAYDTLVKGGVPAERPEDNYEDYIRYLSRQNKEEEEKYWRRYLDGIESATLLPFIAAKAERSKGVGAFCEEKLHWDKQLTTRINSYAKEHRITVNTLMQGTWAWLLHQYTGAEHVNFGVVVSGRPEDLPGVERRVGMYINTLPLHAALHEEESITQWLQHIQYQQGLSSKYQYTSLSDIQRWSGVQGDLFDSIMVFQNYPVSKIVATQQWQLKVENLAGYEPTSNYPLLIRFSVDETITVQFIYKDEFLDVQYVHQIKRDFEHVLLQLLGKAGSQLADVELLAGEERERQLHAYNETGVDFLQGETLVSLFEKQVIDNPGNIALVFDGGEWSYAELNQRVDNLAGQLRAFGIQPDVPVPIFCRRSPYMITAILGILKAGGAYVPVDPDYPQERIDYILNDTGATVLVSSDNSLLTITYDEQKIKTVEVENISPVLTAEEGLSNVATAGNLAYIIYTSGSTGRPKGVMVEHRNIINFLQHQSTVFKITKEERILQFTNYCFDASVEQIFLPLINGAALVLVPEHVRLDKYAFETYLSEQQITHLHTTPAFLQTINPGSYGGLKRVISAGEICKKDLADRWAPICDFYNKYGPTEAAISVAMYLYRPTGKWKDISSVPIGKPVANTQLYVLDKKNNPVPPGVPGELCVGGMQVARGYLNNEALTVQKFVPDPFNGQGHMYRTGDMVRRLPDGNIEFIGRMDEQVKIRGYRIELGEIEHVLQQAPGVTAGVVIVTEDEHQHKRMVGYVVVNQLFDQAAILKYMKGRLPEYMIPGFIVELKSIPLRSSGKIDKKALMAIDSRTLLTASYVAPRDQMEADLSGIWQDLLASEQVGIMDNFFELGGDSIVSIQVVSRARHLGYELQVGDLFTLQTIGQIATALKTRQLMKQEGTQLSVTGECGLLPAQQLYFEGIGRQPSGYSYTISIPIHKAVSPALLAETVSQLPQYHDSLRFVYRRAANGTWTQHYGDRKLELMQTDFSKVASTQFPAAVIQLGTEQSSLLDIERGIVSCFTWIKTADEQPYHQLLVSIHYLIADTISRNILLQTLEGLLAAKIEMTPVPFQHTHISNLQWYESLQRYAASERLQQHTSYWQGIMSVMEAFPADHTSQGDLLPHKVFASLELQLEKSQTTALEQEAVRVYHINVDELLLAALGRVLCNWTGSTDVVIERQGHGRAGDILPEVSCLVGRLASRYPIMLSYAAGMSNSDWIRQIKEQLRQTPDGGLGFDVTQYMTPEKNRAWATILFCYEGDHLTAGQYWGVPVETTRIPDDFGVRERIRIISRIEHGCLRTKWEYSTLHYNVETIKALATEYQRLLEVICADCREKDVHHIVEYSPADFGLSGDVDYKELDRFLDAPLGDTGISKRLSIERCYRLSALQTGMLFHSLYDKDATSYRNQLKCDLRDVDLEAFASSWQQLMRQHTILRTCIYHNVFNIPVQCVLRDVQMPIEIVDYRHLNAAEQETAVLQYELADRQRGFDFETAPLMRVVLLQLGDNHYRMLWTSHHILHDGWSIPVLMEEFLTAYDSLVTGQVPILQPEDRYEDYIRYINRQDKEQAAAYWRQYLEGLDKGTLLPFILPSDKRTKGMGSYQEDVIKLGAAFTSQVVAYARERRITVNTIMQGIWAYLLHQYTGKTNVTFGVVSSGRPEDLPGVERRVGMYINTLPLHAIFQKEQSIGQWLQGIFQDQLRSREYQHTALTDIQRWTAIPGDLFDSIMVFQNYPVSEIVDAHEWQLKVEHVSIEEQANYPFYITIGTYDHIDIHFYYNTALLDQQYVQQIKTHFEQALLQIVSKPAGHIRDITLLSEAHSEEVLHLFNNTDIVTPEHMVGNWIRLFEMQVLLTPDQPALVYEGGYISYRELNERANQLAYQLKDQGVKTGTLIPLCTGRCKEMLIGIIGIQKSGAAYVPVDAAWPAERIAYLLSDTGSAIVVCTEEQEDLIATSSEEVIVMRIGQQLNITDDRGNLPAVAPGDLAYVLYTSGSTGKPKGVMIEHHSLLNYLLFSRKQYTDCYTTAGSFIHLNYTFDASLTALLVPLITGKYVVISSSVATEIFNDDLLYEHAPYDFIKLTPAHMPLLLAAIEQHDTLLTKRLVIGGEALYTHHIRELTAKGKDICVINEYGPTEATVGCCVYTYFPEINDATASSIPIPIGKPLDNMELYILDDQLQPVVTGVAGELYIGGAQLARGYLNQPHLTADRFIDHPFNKEARLYRSGDLARRHPDGNIEYIGRKDEQVKIRGYRVEPEEVVQALQQLRDVRVATVLPAEKESGHLQLYAYIQLNDSLLLDADYHGRQELVHKMRSELQQLLPEYMIPSHIFLLKEFPLTANGKIDKRALLATSADVATGERMAPQNETEEKLVAIWKELLELDEVGVNEDFFHIGGDSLLAIRFISSIRKELNMEVSIGTFFDLKTIEGLSAYLKLNREPDPVEGGQYETIKL